MLEIRVKKLGAELTSVKLDGKEMLHDGKKYWDRQAPILFPTVGRLKDNKTIINNKTYHIPQHGFAKDMEFKLISDELNKKVFLLESNEETLKMYPFKFNLYVTYLIEKNTLTVEYKVENTGNETMIFGIGGHPGIKIDNEKEHFFLLEKEENNVEFMEVDGNYISNNPAPNLLENKRKIKITEKSFINDAIMMKKCESKYITLYENNEPLVKFNFEDFPIIAMWSIPRAPYICIEPWFNYADRVIETGFFKDKEGIIELEKEKTFKCKFSMEF